MSDELCMDVGKSRPSTVSTEPQHSLSFCLRWCSFTALPKSVNAAMDRVPASRRKNIGSESSRPAAVSEIEKRHLYVQRRGS